MNEVNKLGNENMCEVRKDVQNRSRIRRANFPLEVEITFCHSSSELIVRIPPRAWSNPTEEVELARGRPLSTLPFAGWTATLAGVTGTYPIKKDLVRGEPSCASNFSAILARMSFQIIVESARRRTIASSLTALMVKVDGKLQDSVGDMGLEGLIEPEDTESSGIVAVCGFHGRWN